jgi:hypothetical protein
VRSSSSSIANVLLLEEISYDLWLPLPATQVTANACAPQILDPGRNDAFAGPSPSCGMIMT